MNNLPALMAALLVPMAAWSGAPNAQTLTEKAVLVEHGYSLQDEIWLLEEEGVSYRAGFNANSEEALLESLHEKLDQMRLKSENESESLLTLIQVASAVDQLKTSIEQISSQKASGNNGCATGPGVSVSVTPSTRSAHAWAPPTMLGPARGTFLRLTMSYAISNSAPASFAFDGNLGTDTSGSAQSQSSVPSGSTCQLYALAWVTNPVNGCGSWTDAYYNGAC